MFEAVVTVRVDPAEFVPGVTEAGEKEQLAPDGNPDVQARVTSLLKPFCPVLDRV